MRDIFKDKIVSSDGASTTFDIELPSDIAANDVIYVYQTARYTSSTWTMNAISGYSNATSITAYSQSKQQWVYKVAAGTEGGTTIQCSASVAVYWTVSVLIIRESISVK